MPDLHALLFAYSSHAHLKELTQQRNVTSMPFGGRFRVIDFLLSSLVNAGVHDVGMILRENYQSMLDHVGSGKDWDLARKRGGLMLLPPFAYSSVREHYFRGEMETLAGITTYLSRIRNQYVLIADGNLIANLPIEEAYDAHIDSQADITVFCANPITKETANAPYLTLNENGRVVDVQLGQWDPGSYESLNVAIMGKKVLNSLVAYCAARNYFDFNRDILQAMRDKLDIRGFVFQGYAAKLESVSSYFEHNMALLQPEVRKALFLKGRPIRTKVRDEASAYYGPEAEVYNSLIADGCYIEGKVENSILFRGVRVDAGVRIANSILMQDTHVCKDAVLSYAITDKEVLINPGRMLMGHETYPLAIAKGSVV